MLDYDARFSWKSSQVLALRTVQQRVITKLASYGLEPEARKPETSDEPSIYGLESCILSDI